MAVIDILLRENMFHWNDLTLNYEIETKNLKVPKENSTVTLLDFNMKLDDLYTRAAYDYGRIRRLKDIMDGLLESILKDLYGGANDAARRAGGIQRARNFPVDGYEFQTVNLYDLQANILNLYYSMQATIKAIEGKLGAKITSNFLLKIENELITT